MTHSEIVGFIWSVADLIRDTFKRGKYQNVILPMTVLRRLDCVLAPTKPEVLRRHAELKGRPEAIPGHFHGNGIGLIAQVYRYTPIQSALVRLLA